jgi:hypothetical protein
MIASRAIAAGHPAAMRSQQRVSQRTPQSLRRPLARRQTQSFAEVFLTTATAALKFIASGLAGAAVTLVFWHGDDRPARPHALEREGGGQVYYQVRQPSGAESRHESVAYRSAPQRPQLPAPAPVLATVPTQAVVSQAVAPSVPREVQTAKLAPAPTRPAPAQSAVNPLAGKPLRYLIGADSAGRGGDGEVTMVSYSATQPAQRGVSVAYCNLFDERNTGRYGPYLHTSGTAKQYNEGQIDPHGPGWERNLREQFERRKKQGFEYIELDNADAYGVKDVIGAIELAATYGLKVIAKNPSLLESGAAPYVAHPNVHGIIVERGAGNAEELDALRRKAGKPNLPTWFVSFGGGRGWANGVANAAKNYRNMGVTYSSAGEYGNSIDILTPSDAGRS